ncbi:MAG: UMP kinase [Candidatus Woesearchaeota archaeon]
MNLKKTILKNNFFENSNNDLSINNKNNKLNTVIFSLGGSLIYPNTININYLIEFKKFILNFIKDKNKAIIVCGGGNICREYNKSALKINKKITNENLDWLGISLTKVNAELLRCIFQEKAYENIINNPYKTIETDKKILIAGGYKPGNSSDKMAVLLAKQYSSKIVINLTNIDKIYDKDPKKHKNATPFSKISWKEFLKIIDDKWIPGMNVPFDPKASKIAMENNINTLIINGNNIENLKNYLEKKEYIGTIISN